MGRKLTRFYLIGLVIILFAITIVYRLIQIQTDPFFTTLSDSVGDQASVKIKKYEPVRGIIYDRWGNLLAGNSEVYEIGVNLNQVKEEDKADLVNFLSSITGKDREIVNQRVSIPYNPNPESEDFAVFSTIYKDAPKEMIAEIEAAQEENGHLLAISWTGRLNRTYPEGSMGINFLGFYSSDGFYGVEGFYNNILSTKSTETNISMNPYDVMAIPEIPQGAGIILTIDREIQLRVEDIMDRAIKENGASSGTAIVMDPETGEILAMTSTPRANPNQSADLILAEYPIESNDGFDIQTPFNRAVMQTYEPGSVFKVFTMAAALDSGTVSPDTEFIDNGVQEYGGLTIYNWDYGAWGVQNMTGCMQHSLNVCMVWLVKQMGTETFYNYLTAFNINGKSNVDLDGEATYPLLSPNDPTPFGSDPSLPRWTDSTTATQSFGQGVAVTPIRMIASASALANDGRMMAPHIQKAIVQDGRVRYYNPKIVGTPIKPETASTITEMLTISLEGESSTALVEGYRVAGKTGTAEIPTSLGYTSGLTNASFIGWGPSDDPKFIVYIWLEKPTTSIWASLVTAPVFSEIVDHLVILMNIPPDSVRSEFASK
ncbi:MAG: penicillin-binding protein 2 [Anaerolineaceae bacterium]|nr:penicillin-binding protein 2 [Anaerolineaceae bacterium]